MSSKPASDDPVLRRVRRVRSYMRRQGRMTPGQEHAIARLWPRFGIAIASDDAIQIANARAVSTVALSGGVLNLDAVFGRAAPRVLEIGFGNGDSLAEMAAQHPEQDYLGIEVHRPGVGHLLHELERRGLNNVRVVAHDAVEVMQHLLADASLERVQLFFPDPWPKKRHHKRRIVQPGFVQLVRSKLKPGGVFHMATDWAHYAQHMLAVMRVAPGFRNLAEADYVPRPATRPCTRFEARGQRLGHGVYDLMFERDDGVLGE